jgi:hypothetical protein
MVKMFRLDDNVKTVQDKQRTGSIANNSNLEQQDQLCAKMISEVVKVAAERVNKSRTASITTKKIDEVGQLQTFLSRTLTNII